MSNFIEIRDVVKQYSGHLALDGVSMDIPRGSVYGLLGPNGAGKTTLIRIINRITAPDSGEILFNGKKLSAEDVQNIGYLPEERGLYKKMKVGEQALYLARLKGMSKADAMQELKFWFEKFGIEGWWNKKIEELSKGMAQKVQFITTILHKPELLIFDEPFSGFDPVNADLLKREILELRDNGATIIFSTHNMESVEELCENISLIDHSKIVLQGNMGEIRAQFASETLSVKTAGSIDLKTAEVVSATPRNGFMESVLKKPESVSNRQVLEEIIQQTEVFSFEEHLPSMNDIFIRTVGKKTP